MVIKMIEKEQYKERVEQASNNSPILLNCVKAFLAGGAICVLGQALTVLYSMVLPLQTAKTLTSVTLIFLGAMLTGLGVYHKIAKHTGAGTQVPITGFANAVASSAVEFKSEGWIMGVGAKIFSVAGPVIAYCLLASVIYGIVYWGVGMIIPFF
ncbi:MAG: SpoVA/SpoVAEb family sporulation membrane protein [Oscillospiraceae bacterium]|nr:SpoVA/SpoVAEb family sporulation membrane protein [Oscillospiraceae bacterium]